MQPSDAGISNTAKEKPQRMTDPRLDYRRTEMVLGNNGFLVDTWFSSQDRLVVHFEVREQVNDDPEFLYSNANNEPVTDPNKAQIYISGHMKWDQCSNISLPDHFCYREEVVRLGDLLGRIYDLAKEMIGKNWLE